MKTIAVTEDSADLDITLDELIVIRNSLNQMLSNTKAWELHTLTGFHPQEIEEVLKSVEQVIKELQ